MNCKQDILVKNFKKSPTNADRSLVYEKEHHSPDPPLTLCLFR